MKGMYRKIQRAKPVLYLGLAGLVASLSGCSMFRQKSVEDNKKYDGGILVIPFSDGSGPMRLQRFFYPNGVIETYHLGEEPSEEHTGEVLKQKVDPSGRKVYLNELKQIKFMLN
jgi:hypothetical protein